MCLRLSRVIEKFFEYCFSKWGSFVARRPCLVFLIGSIVALLMGIGTFFPQKFRDQ